jgi:hypothetical protein
MMMAAMGAHPQVLLELDREQDLLAVQTLKKRVTLWLRLATQGHSEYSVELASLDRMACRTPPGERDDLGFPPYELQTRPIVVDRADFHVYQSCRQANVTDRVLREPRHKSWRGFLRPTDPERTAIFEEIDQAEKLVFVILNISLKADDYVVGSLRSRFENSPFRPRLQQLAEDLWRIDGQHTRAFPYA